MNELFTRSEAIAAIQCKLGDTEEAAQVIDWIWDMWETMDELSQRLSPVLACKIIQARRFQPLKQEPPMIKLEFTSNEAITIGAALTQYQMYIRRAPENQQELQDVLTLLEYVERRFIEAVGGKNSDGEARTPLTHDQT